MVRILEYLEQDTSGAQRAFRRAKCDHALGEADDYRTVAGTYDDSINPYEPVALTTRDDTYVLRHYCCPSCGVVFEVEMVSRVLG